VLTDGRSGGSSEQETSRYLFARPQLDGRRYWLNARILEVSLIQRSNEMAEPKGAGNEIEISRDRLGELLNEDLAREYQAIIAYVVYSQVLTGAQYMDIAGQLERHAKQELDHALILSRQIDYLGKMPVVTPKPVRTSKNPEDMLRYDLDIENETIRNYRDRVRQCTAQHREYSLQALGDGVEDVRTRSRPIG
jgi:bacterioferritin